MDVSELNALKTLPVTWLYPMRLIWLSARRGRTVWQWHGWLMEDLLEVTLRVPKESSTERDPAALTMQADHRDVTPPILIGEMP